MFVCLFLVGWKLINYLYRKKKANTVLTKSDTVYFELFELISVSISVSSFLLHEA